jgi:hypothetical protein
MTAKEHAYRVCLLFRCELEYLDGTEAHKDMRAKQCALIAVDEMINWKETLFVTEGSMAYQYLLKVKQEIQNL